MASKKISKKPKGSFAKSKMVTLKAHKVLDARILTKENLKNALADALFEGDLETIKDIVIAQIRLCNKAELVRKTKLGRQTLYDLIDGKREFNPTLKTLGTILKAIAS